MQTKEGLLSAETLGFTTAQNPSVNTDFVVFLFCILKATTYQIFASFRKGETKAWRQAANIVHQAQSEFLTDATVTGAIALEQRSSLFEEIQCKSGPPSEFYKARSRQPPSACAIPRRPETIKGPSHLHHHHHHFDRRRRRRRRHRAKRGSGANRLTDRPSAPASIGRSKLISSIDSWSGPEGRRRTRTKEGRMEVNAIAQHTRYREHSLPRRRVKNICNEERHCQREFRVKYCESRSGDSRKSKSIT